MDFVFLPKKIMNYSTDWILEFIMNGHINEKNFVFL